MVTGSDLTHLEDLTPAQRDRYARHATLLVADYMRNHAGNYTNEIVRAAELAQCEFWHANKLDPVTSGLNTGPGIVASVSANGTSYTIAGAEATATARVNALHELCWESLQVLQAVSRRRTRVTVVG
ncbi:MAG: hypothetical protein QM234_03950 [Acidobacteriota bacterium]|nr:hypothetical protein [Acidobacteriota bacterium]